MMDTLDTSVAPHPAPPSGQGDESGLTASKGFLGLAVALVGGVAAVLLVTVVFAAADVQDNHALEFVAAFVSDFVLFAAAWFITAETGGPTAWKLGFRRFAPSAFG